MQIEKTQKGAHDYNRGIRAYTSGIMPCSACKRLCNTYWQPTDKTLKPVFTCGQDCADKIAHLIVQD